MKVFTLLLERVNYVLCMVHKTKGSAPSWFCCCNEQSWNNWSYM